MKITTPLTEEAISSLHAGDKVLITGTIYTARDAAHLRLVKLIENNEPLPFDIKNQVLYYVGPTPAKPNKAIGSAGPTTSYRMDPYTPTLLKHGLKGMVGKGDRNQEVKDAIKEYKAIYMGAVGGAAALIAKSIKKCELIAYPDLGAEAIYKLDVIDFPAIVVNDIYGNDLIINNIKKYNMEGKNE